MSICSMRRLAVALVLVMVLSSLSAAAPAIAAGAGDGTADVIEHRLMSDIGELLADGVGLPEFDPVPMDKTERIYILTSNISEINEILVKEGLDPIKKKEKVINVLDITVTRRLAREISQLPSVGAVVPYSAPSSIPLYPDDRLPDDFSPQPNDAYTVEEHHATSAWSMGYDGTGVKIAILDSGVDFGHPDLQGRQARMNNPASPYDGWPIVFDVSSVYLFETSSGSTVGTWYADMRNVETKLGDFVYFDGYRYNVSDIPSFFDVYRIGYHPDQNLQTYYGEPVAVLMPLNTSTFNFDTVYVDLLNDKTFNNDKPCYKGNEISYFDGYNATGDIWDTAMWNSGDGIADLSGGMIYWISDGANSMPLADVFGYAGAPLIPAQGEIVTFVGEFNLYESHGTGTTSLAVGTGRTMGGLLAGMAPNATVIAVPIFGSGSITDAWYATCVGYDDFPDTGDEANIASNSYGWASSAVESGLDFYSGVNFLYSWAFPGTTWMWSTGNGGPGYGTGSPVTQPLAIMVGAATSMGYRYLLGSAATDDPMYGDVIPFSDVGPTKAGRFDTDVIAAGAFGFTPAPLYQQLWYMPTWSPNGESALMIFGGTSMSCPVAAGALALMYHAFYDANGRFPYYFEAKSLIMSSADDVNYDVLKQGAGYVNAERGVRLAADLSGVSVLPNLHPDSGLWLDNSTWYPGGYEGTNYLNFPNIVFAGDVYAKEFELRNHDPLNDTVVTASDYMFQNSGIYTDLSITTTNGADFFLDITSYVPGGTDLLRVTAYCSYDDYFDPGRTYDQSFNYGLELHDWIDLTPDGIPDSSEFNGITVDSGKSNVLSVTMHDPLDRITDGLILRMDPYWGGRAGIEWNFRIESFNKVDWSWLSLDSGTVNIPAGSVVYDNATITIPLSAEVGTYEGAIYFTEGANTTVVPILVHVAADGPEFEFGGNLLDRPIFDNNVSGVANRDWRYDVGDWRAYYCYVPPGYVIGPTDSLYVTVNWSDVPTDIDVHMLSDVGPSRGYVHEPYMLGYVGGSDEYYLGAGNFGYRTTTGGAQEVVAVPFYNGLNEIVLRNPISAGLSPYEQITGFTQVLDDWCTYSPSSISFDLNIPAVDPSGSVPIDVSVGGLSGLSSVPFGAMTYGPFGGFVETLSTNQSDWTYRTFELLGSYDYMRLGTDSGVADLDIDLYVYWLDPSTMLWVLIGASGGSSARESVLVETPLSGAYMAAVYGYSVPGGGPLPFSLSVEYPVVGTSFGLVDVPSTVSQFSSLRFNLTYQLPYVAMGYMGYVSFGFLGSANSFRIPISIVLNDCGDPVLEAVYPTEGETIADSSPLIEVYFNDTAAYSGLDEGSLELLLDGTSMTWMSTVSGDAIFLPIVFNLSDGAHSLAVSAADNGGNYADPLLVTFYVDTQSELTVRMENSIGTTIPSGGVTNESSIEVIGVAEPNSTVTVNGAPVAVNPITGGFNKSVSLVEGSNSISVVATDEAANSKSVNLQVTSDTSVYLVIDPVTSPTSSSAVTISGVIEIGGLVTVNGTSVTVTDGSFSTTVSLSEGVNSITVIGRDVAGNEVVRTVSVTMDTTPPSVSITSPGDGESTSLATVNISVSSESTATVTINGVTAVLVDDGVFVATVTLSEGWNTITAIASDELGNSASAWISLNYIPVDESLSAMIESLTMMVFIGLIAVLAALIILMMIVYTNLNRKIGGGRKPAPGIEMVERDVKGAPPKSELPDETARDVEPETMAVEEESPPPPPENHT